MFLLFLPVRFFSAFVFFIGPIVIAASVQRIDRRCIAANAAALIDFVFLMRVIIYIIHNLIWKHVNANGSRCYADDFFFD